jgi:glutamyl-tRNA reductase
VSCFWNDPGAIGQAILGITQKVVSLRTPRLLLLGAGAGAVGALRTVRSHTAAPLLVADPVPARAVETALLLGGEAIPFSTFRTRLRDTDLVVSAVGSCGRLLTRVEMEGVIIARNRRSQLLFDLCSPPSIDPLVHRIDGLFLYDLQDLHAALAPHMCQRRREVARGARHS